MIGSLGSCRASLIWLGLWATFHPSLVSAQDVDASDDCAPAPIEMPIMNVTLPSGKTRRGVSMGVGQPVKQFAVLPSWVSNNTFIFGPDCDFKEEFARCDTFRGGLYDPDESDSDGTLNSDYSGPRDSFPSNTYEFFTDNFTIDDNVFVEDFPFARPKETKDWDLQGYRPMHMLGMDTGSTFLASLLESKTIASRSWAWWWGLDGRNSNDQRAGSMILGGYDRAKTYGDGYTRPMEGKSRCPTGMLVYLEDIVLNLSNGTDLSLFNKESGGQSIRVCLAPALPVVMDLPYDPYFYTWQTSIGVGLEWGRSVGEDYWNILMNDDDDEDLYGSYDGDLTLDFGSEFRITIPNDHLVVPETSIDEDGDLFSNSTSQLLRINSLQDTTSSSMPMLGKYFFTQAYLFCNEDAGEFTLWAANPTSSKDIVAVDKSGQTVASGEECPDRPTPLPPAASPTEQSTPETDEERSGSGDDQENNESGGGDDSISPGVIAGVAIGAALGAGLLLAGLWWWCRRRNAEEPEQQQATITNPNMLPWDEHKSPPPEPPFQGYPHFIPQELPHQPPSRGPSHYEMPA